MRGRARAGTVAGMTDAPSPMHDSEVRVDAALVTRLLAGQCPQWAGLPVTLLRHSGTDNAVVRLGDGLVARLPRIGWAAADVAKEARWLPLLAPGLPLRVPEVLFTGVPGAGYPFGWGVYGWLPGVDAAVGTVRDEAELARDLAAFVRALQATPLPLGQGPVGSRGVPLAERDAATRDAIRACAQLGFLDEGAALAVWKDALKAAPHVGPPAWLHADLKPGNLLSDGGRLSAVIDWGGLTLGDPAVDLQPAWNLLGAAGRAAFREALGVEDAAWARGRGWALSVSVIALPYYRDSNPGLAGVCRDTLRALLSG